MAAKKVLIVEDDSILANALAGAVKKAGYESVICASPDQAIETLDRDSFKLMFIDCLLPQTPGVDLAKAIRKNFDAKILPIVLMSGIFTDKQMMKDMTDEIGAIDFLKKPFEVNQVLRFLETESAATNDESLARSIFSLQDRIGANPSQLEEILHSVKRIHGYELPILFAAAVGNSYSGVIHLLGDKGEKTKVTMGRGFVTAVESPDIQSYLGKLLVAKGWVLPEDLELILKQPSEKKLGLRLAEENLISPHAVLEVMEEQMALRLSKTIQDQNYAVHFEDKWIGSESEAPSLDPEEFYLLLDEWICSRVSGEWLNHQLTNWQDYSVRLGPSHDKNRKEYSVRVISDISDIVKAIENIGTLASLHQSHQNQLIEFNRAFYYMLCLRFVSFAEKVAQMSEGERVARLQKIWGQIKDINLIEVLQMMGGRKDMSKEEAHSVFADFLQRHLGSAPANKASPAFISVYESVKAKVNQAYELHLDPQKLALYERELESGKVSQRSEAQSKADEAKKFLSMRQYASAIILINKATELYPKLDYLVVYRVWAKVGLLPNSKNKAKEIIEIDQLMARVPSEEKISPVGNFVQGLVSKVKGDNVTARKFFEAALAIDKNLLDARRELNGLPPLEVKKPVDLLHGDLGQVIGNLFKKS
jgi:FixJ family two-component response regulator/tetratricopeptide (TPR) repeat protein